LCNPSARRAGWWAGKGGDVRGGTSTSPGGIDAGGEPNMALN